MSPWENIIRRLGIERSDVYGQKEMSMAGLSRDLGRDPSYIAQRIRRGMGVDPSDMEKLMEIARKKGVVLELIDFLP